MAEGNQMNIPGSNNISVQSVQGGTVIINQLGQQFKIPHEITYIPYISLDDVVGRDDELNRLYEQLHKPGNNITTVVNGLGGVGKTTLAQAYISLHKDNYGHKVWFTQNSGGDFIQDVCNTALIKQKLGISSEIQKNEDVFNEVFGRIQLVESADNKNLPDILIIDNADENIIKYKEYLPQHWHILITSRNELAPFRPFKLDFLTEPEAVELFKLPYNESNGATSLTNEQILQIIKMVDCHTLTLSILSRSAKENDWDYEQIINALSEDKRANIHHPYTNDERIDRIKTFLTGIFNLSSLNEQQLYILERMALMPSEFIPIIDIRILLQYDILDWKEDFVHNLRSLYRNGWLLKTINEEKYKLHVIIGDIIKENNKNSFNFEPYISQISTLLSINFTKDNPVDKFKWITYGENLINSLHTSPRYKLFLKQLAELESNLGLILDEAGNYQHAKVHFENALEIDLLFFDEADENIATDRSHLAMIYWKLKNSEKAIELIKLALESDIKNFGENHQRVATERNNLAMIYLDLGNLNESATLLELALESLIKHLGENHPDVASARSNLGIIYRKMNNLDKAAALSKLALDSDMKNFEENHPKIVVRMGNLAQIYLNLKRYSECIDLMEKSYTISLNLLGESHPKTQIAKANLEYAKRAAAGKE